MNGFSFFESYYESAKVLPDDERRKFFTQIINYAYTGEETEELGAVAAALWIAVKPNVENSRTNSGRGGRKPAVSENEKPSVSEKTKTDGSGNKQNRRLGKGEERKGKEKEKDKEKEKEKDKEKDKDLDIPPKSPHGGKGLTAEEMIEAKHYPSVLESAVKDWVQYKIEKREGYRPMGLKSLLTEIENNANQYGDAAVIDVINKSMAAGYMGITWDWLKRKPVARSGTTDSLDAFLQGG